MLYKESVSDELINTLSDIFKINEFNNFRLAGGTALALQIGHRISFDLDIFTEHSFDIDNAILLLKKQFNLFLLNNQTPTGFTCFINNIKCDFYNWNTKFIDKAIQVDNIKMYSIDEIASMKLHTILTRTHIRDFIDIAFLLKENDLVYYIAKFKEKYPYYDCNMVLKSLIDKIDDFTVNDKKITLLKPISDIELKSIIKQNVELFYKVIQEKKDKEVEERNKKIKDLINQK